MKRYYKILYTLLEFLKREDYAPIPQFLKNIEQTKQFSTATGPFPYPDSMIPSDLFIQILHTPKKVFLLVYEFLTRYYVPFLDTFPFSSQIYLTAHRTFNSPYEDFFSTSIKIACCGRYLEFACRFRASVPNLKYLLEHQVCKWHFGMDGAGTHLSFTSHSLLAYAIVHGDLSALKSLLKWPEYVHPQDLSLQAMVLFGLYLPDSLDTIFLISRRAPVKAAAKLVAEKVYHLSDLPPDSLAGADPALSAYAIPMKLCSWVIPQGWVAPLNVLRHWFSTGRYGRREALGIVYSYKHTHSRYLECSSRILLLFAMMLRYVPEIGNCRYFTQLLFKNSQNHGCPSYTSFDGYLDAMALLNGASQGEHKKKQEPEAEDNVEEDADYEKFIETLLEVKVQQERRFLQELRIGAKQMRQPMGLRDKQTIQYLMSSSCKLHGHILQLLHDTCGVKLCGEALTFSPDTDFMSKEDIAKYTGGPYPPSNQNSNSRSSFSKLLKYCTRDTSPLQHCSFITRYLAVHGTKRDLVTALKNGLLKGEPWPEFIQLLNHFERNDLIPIAQVNNPNQSQYYDL